jgi:Spy/CpxP family protein refolding chaperone
MLALRQQQRTQMEAILTPEQKAQWEKMRSEHRLHMDGGKQRNGDSSSAQNGRNWKDHNGGANLQKELNLTEEQQAKVKEIRNGFRSKAEALRNDQSLTQEQKQTQFRTLMQQQQEQLKTVLTPEQQEKWQQLRKERRGQNTK